MTAKPGAKKRVTVTRGLRVQYKPPLRRFDCFFGEEERKTDPEEMFLDSIGHKISHLALQVSRIENRLSDYETRSNDDLNKPYMLEDVPPKPQRRRKLLEKTFT